jgi:hypothetical protein
MSDNVVPLRAGLLPQGEPEKPEVNERLVEELERILEAARAGEIVGMAGAYLHREKGASYSFAGVVGSYSLIGGLECAKQRLLAIVLGR